MRAFAVLTLLLFLCGLAAAEPGAPIPLGIRPVLGVVMPNENIVTSVVPGSIAAQIELLPGDRIVSANGKAIKGVNDLRAVVTQLNLGDRLAIVYARGGKEVSKTVTFAAPKNPFKAFVIKEGVGLPGEIEVGMAADKVARMLATTPVASTDDYKDYPGWTAEGDKRRLLQREILGVTAGVVDGKVVWVDFFFPMIARTDATLATVGRKDEADAKYGAPEKTTEDGDTIWYHYPSRGVSVAFYGDTVRRIVVYAKKK